MLATQLNSAFIWGCSAAGRVGEFNYSIGGYSILKGEFDSLRNILILSFLKNLIYLLPLNVFLYSWRFMREIEMEEQNSIIKKCFRWFARISIVILPTAFISIVSAYIYEKTMFSYYFLHG